MLKRVFTGMFMILALLATPVMFVGCDQGDGPAEEAGESVDEAVEATGDALDDARDEAEEAID